MVKKSKGRQKIEMVKMKNESNLQVTFSKRRSGLFKKASELCTLCGAEIAMIVFSPGRKVFSFGHPNVETVIDRFFNNNPQPLHQHNNMQLGEAHRNSVVRDMNDHLTQVLNMLECEKKKNEELKMMREKAKRPEYWWENGVDGLNFGQLNGFQSKLDSLKDIVTLEASKFFQANVPPQNFYIESSNNAGFGIGGGGSNANPDLDLFGQRRMVNLNAFTNQNMMLPNHALQLGNNGNVTERFVLDYNVNNHQNQNQSQNLSFKTENISEFEHHPGHPPHPGSGHF